jgi:hypothetical protein
LDELELAEGRFSVRRNDRWEVKKVLKHRHDM